MSTRLPAERTLTSSGLVHLWAQRYPALAGAGPRRLAVRHVTESLRELGPAPRLALTAALGVFGVLTGGSRDDGDPRPARRAAALARLPGAAQVVRVTTTLALLGALDGTAPRPRPVTIPIRAEVAA